MKKNNRPDWRKKYLTPLSAALFTAAVLPIYPMDSIPFIIKLQGFSQNIFSQKITSYSLSSSDKNFSLIENCHQKIDNEKFNGEKKVITIKTGNINNRCGIKPEEGLLIDTQFLNLDSREIKETASKFRNARDPIPDIESFVHNYISKKIIGIPIIPAVKILENKTGDCTEHSILAISLLRSNNIPSRAVVGIYLADYFEGNKNVFVYHMWAEAYYNGNWRLVDSTRPGKKAYNRYIAFAYHSLKTGMPLSFLKAVSAIKDMEIIYLEAGN